MIRIAQQNLHAKLGECLLRQSFHCALCPDRHERGRVDRSVRGCETPKPRAGRISFQNFEAKFHAYILADLSAARARVSLAGSRCIAESGEATTQFFVDPSQFVILSEASNFSCSR